MTRDELSRIVDSAKCRVLGADDAANAGHRLTLAALTRAFDRTESALLCEPSLARKTTRPPDVVLIDPEIGVHVVEVKGVTLDQIDRLEAGGQIAIRYATRVKLGNPLTQARNAMFDIRDATARAFNGDIKLLPFRCWAAFPLIRRADWLRRFGAAAFCPVEFLFADDLTPPAALARRLGVATRSDPGEPTVLCPLDQLQAVWRAFGDTSVLYATPEDRPARRADEGTLGEQFDEAAEAHKALSDEQQRLSAMNWDGGPRLVRGVAGSGKTVVLANNLARRLDRMLVARQEATLFAGPPANPRPRLLAVCFNRTLAPLIERKVNAAFLQRTGRPVPDGTVDVMAFNALMWKLTSAGVWRYQGVKDADDIVRALQYLGDLNDFRDRDPARLADLAYDAIYVDEGQDFAEEQFRLLKELCRIRPGAEPNLHVFYDDAQNLYGHGRPNWRSLGLNVVGGRSHVMARCFRNPRKVVEAAFNVLYGACAPPGVRASVPTREYGNLPGLAARNLIDDDHGFWRVKFAPRDGMKPRLSLAATPRAEIGLVVTRLRWLIEEQEVRPEDVLVLARTQRRVKELADAIADARIKSVAGVQVPLDRQEKDRRLCQRGHLTVSTVASAKGYDAFCVLLTSANEFPADVTGRATFYVACTRAVEYLEVFAHEKRGLAQELDGVLQRIGE